MLLTLLADACDGCAVLQNAEDEHDGDHDRQYDQARGNQVPHIARHGLIPNHKLVSLTMRRQCYLSVNICYLGSAFSKIEEHR